MKRGAIKKRFTKEEFVRRSLLTHTDEFDYSAVVVDGCYGRVQIMCHKGHVFYQLISAHIVGGGCPYCNRKLMDTSTFIEAAVEVHGDKFNYSKVEYKDSRAPVKITCQHGHSFQQVASDHLRGKGCAQCARKVLSDARRKTQEQFIEEAKSVHTGFDYSQSVYTGDRGKVTITCPVGHTFKQTARGHLQGRCCPHCATGGGFSPSKPGSVYVLTDGNLVKIGITNNPVEIRVSQINSKSGKNFDIAYSIDCEDGSLAQAIESVMKKFLKSEYEQPDYKFDGYTECYYDADVSMIARMLDQHKINIEGIL